MTCNHVWSLFRTANQPPVVLCMLCYTPKPPEPCQFSEVGEADRKSLEQRDS